MLNNYCAASTQQQEVQEHQHRQHQQSTSGASSTSVGGSSVRGVHDWQPVTEEEMSEMKDAMQRHQNQLRQLQPAPLQSVPFKGTKDKK